MRDDCSLRLLTPGPTSRVLVATTSEADALHLAAAAGHLLGVATTEGAGLAGDVDIAFELAEVVLVLADGTDAGERIAAALVDKLPAPSLRLILPADRGSVGELRERGELVGWLAAEWARFGSPWPAELLSSLQEDVIPF
jgi:hypothetical protein